MIAPQRGRFRRLALATVFLAGRVLRQHYLSFASAIVIAVLFGLVMTSESFVSERERPRPSSPAMQAAQQDRAEAPRRRRLSALYFILDSEEQRSSISEAVMADQLQREDGTHVYDYVFYIIAGTLEQESRAISRLDFEASFAQQNGVDMRIVDVRTQSVR